MSKIFKLILSDIFGAVIFFSFFKVQSQEVEINQRGVPTVQQSQTANIPTTAISSTELSLFGHNLFTLPEELRSDVFGGGLMFPENYRLGAGDRLGIYLLGKIQQNFEVIVNVEGKIYLPTVGVFYVANMTIEQFRTFLEEHLSKFYDNFSLNLMLIEPKRIPVMVVGDVNRPGKYFLSSLNTVLDAMIWAGGPTGNGSLRNIHVFRQNELIERVDFYQFLMTGEIPNEIFLQQYDRIVVPLVEAMASIRGEVKRQAKFELKSGAEERLSDLVYLAGGFTDLAYLDRVEISRLLPDGERTVYYVNYHEILKNDSCISNIKLQNDDQVRVYSIIEQTYQKYVYIHGEVKRPGRYPLEENLHVLDLILKAGNITRSAFLLECEVAKIDPKKPTKSIKINLQRLMNNSNNQENILLEEDDRLFIRQIPEWEVGLTVEVKGEVNFPGIYAITKDSTTLSEIIDKAGGFTEEALIREASLIRTSTKNTVDKEYERLKQLSRDQMSRAEYQYLVLKQNSQDIGLIVVDFYKVCVLKNKSDDVILEDGDVINVPKAPKVIYVTGRVGIPGGVLYKPNKNIKYYLNNAGGPAWDAKVRGIKVSRVTGEILNDEDVKKLEPGDIIWVPRRSDRDWWELFSQTIAIVAQLATVYIVADRAITK